MKKTVLLILITLFVSCKAKKHVDDASIDEYITLCYNQEIVERFDSFIDDTPKSFLDSIQNIHLNFEKVLIEENVLTDNSKNSYIQLYTNWEENKSSVSNAISEFIKTINFYPDTYFDGSGALIPKVCLYNAYFKYHLFDENSWYYKLGRAMDDYEAGREKFIESHLKIIETIPDEEFDLIVYRAYLLNDLYLTTFNQ